MKYRQFRYKKTIYILGTLVLLGVFLVLSLPVYATCNTNCIKSVSDVVTDSAPSSTANHTYQFTVLTDIPVSGQIVITPESGGHNIPSEFDYTDIDLLVGGSQQTLASSAGSGADSAWGVDVVTGTSGSITLTQNDTDTVSADSVIQIRMGTNAIQGETGDQQITNPSAVGPYDITVDVYNASLARIAYSQTIVFIIETVGVSAGLGNVSATIQWMVPELRVGDAATNDDVKFALYVHSSAEGDGTNLHSDALFATSAVYAGENDGTYSTPITFDGISAGTYDVILKTNQHISKKLNDITLENGTNVLNFSTTDNSAPKGAEVLLAGDVSNSDTDPALLGDNVVNSVDLSILLDDIDEGDADGNTLRANVNHDTVVNSVDISIYLKNLDDTGEVS